MKIMYDIACNLNSVQFKEIQFKIQLTRNRMKIGAQGIKNMLIISTIHNYGVEKKTILKRQRSKNAPSIPLREISKLKSILVGHD